MRSVVEIAGTILSRAFERTEVSAQNIANMTTPGYKARQWFPLAAAGAAATASTKTAVTNFSAGQLQSTSNPFDLALSGAGFFVVQSPDSVFYTRDGQFSRGEDGKIVTADGLTLQDADGGDLVVKSDTPQITNDGTVLVDNEPVARVAVAGISDTSVLQRAGQGLFTAPDDAVGSANPTIRQGMLETSNVSTADEMISIMAALRSAESGQKILQVYDDLMGRTIDAFRQ